ncbi:MAG TPA: ATP-grasp domain-containing protein [Gemmatimonadales bacterium]|jgi:predicted ATP-grasp superfamily ATP-dependent carboligase|nr:ATP-grasp domain-containing protein [Gemmatimonadales bacterium]
MRSIAAKQRFDTLVLDASLRQSLVTVRCLGRRGLGIAAAETHPRAPAFASRWCQRGLVFSAKEGTDAYYEMLEHWLERTGAGLLIASHDATIALLRSYRARLEPRVHLALAAEPALAIAINKERTLAVARGLGLQVPREAVVRNDDEIAAALDAIGLPAVIKPCESWLWNGRDGVRLGAKLAVTRAEAQHAIEAVTRFGQAVQVQQLLTGRREAVSFLYAKGEVYARFAQWAMRTSPPLGGDSVLRQSIAIPPDIGSQAESLVREIDLEGYCEVEFRRDAAGVPYLMEINPRLSASVEIAVRAGVDFPYLLYQWASGGPIERVAGYHTGGWMRHLGGDITTMVASLRQRGRPGITRPVQTLVNFGRAFLKPMAYDYMNWTDPLPAVRAMANFTQGALRSLASAAVFGAWYLP